MFAVPPVLIESRSRYHVPDEQRLYEHLMVGYESSVRPVINASRTILVNFRLTLNQIIDLVSRPLDPRGVSVTVLVCVCHIFRCRCMFNRNSISALHYGLALSGHPRWPERTLLTLYFSATVVFNLCFSEKHSVL